MTIGELPDMDRSFFSRSRCCLQAAFSRSRWLSLLTNRPGMRLIVLGRRAFRGLASTIDDTYRSAMSSDFLWRQRDVGSRREKRGRKGVFVVVELQLVACYAGVPCGSPAKQSKFVFQKNGWLVTGHDRATSIFYVPMARVSDGNLQQTCWSSDAG